MFARVATFEGVDAEEADRTLEEMTKRVEPLMRALPGFKGYVDLMDRASGKAVTISFFDSEENLTAAEPTFDEEMPRALGDLMEQMSGRRTSVERYEVVVDARA